jgi:hypothetical protein
MTPDGIAPDLDRPLNLTEPTRWLAEGHGVADSAADDGAAADPSVERMWRAHIALDRVRDELLRAHTSTVLTMCRSARDHARVSVALVEARRQHEALFLLRRAVDALTTPARRV